MKLFPIYHLKILLLNSLGIFGGGEYFVHQLARFLSAKGKEVWVGCRKNTPIYTKCKDSDVKVTVFDFPEKGTGKLSHNIKSIKSFVVEKGINIVHSNTNYDRTAGAAAAELAGAKHAASVHSLESISHNLTHWARNKFFVDVFIADGKIVRDFLIKENKIDGNKIRVINLGIEPDSMALNDKLRINVRKEFGIAEGEILIGNLGRLVEFKGQSKLISAFKVVSEDFSSARLMIVGDGELRAELENQASSLGLSDKVHFAGFRDDLQAVYSAFDLYVHTSNEGGGELFPYAVLYAMTRGLPVVSTGVGEIPNIVKDELNGYITGHNVHEVGAKIKALLNDSSLIKRLGEESRKRLCENFTLEKMGNEILKLYAETLSIRDI